MTLWLWNRIFLFRLACLVNSHHKITYHEGAKNQRELSDTTALVSLLISFLLLSIPLATMRLMGLAILFLAHLIN